MEKIKIASNGQWALEKMSWKQTPEEASSRNFGRQWEFDNQLSPLNGEQAVKTSKIKSRDGKNLFHHVVTNPHDPDFVRHMITDGKDIYNSKVLGVASGRAQKAGIQFKAADDKTLKMEEPSYALGGINVDNDQRNKGIGEHIFHAVVHHHGNVIGDTSYTPGGWKVTDKVASNPAYHYTKDSDQTEAQAKKDPTRIFISLKNKSNMGKIPVSIDENGNHSFAKQTKKSK
jgi:hypothetical protein